MEPKNLLEKLLSHVSLSNQEAREVMEAIMEGSLPHSVVSALLVALRAKGESSTEIAAFAQVMREKATPIPVDAELVVDTCGTGGDSMGSYNISTTVGLLLAGGGYKVAKHGNRSMTSRSGSADVLEALGVKIDLSPEQVGQVLQRCNFGFLFAPALHGAMKYVMPVRKELGIRTVFNLLGPLTNPAQAHVQVIGLYDQNRVVQIAEVLKSLGSRAAYVVAGLDGMDEVSIQSNSRIARLKDGEIVEFEFDPENFGYPKASGEELRGGDPEENAQITRGLLAGEILGPKRDVLVLNAGFALSAAEGSDLKEGFQLAEKLLDEKRGLEALECLKETSHQFAS
ncbi:MAG: anthranilate phosphoribosyltransferase [bacterium]|nr:anthranilate phosphoribosyltransferase [bacterium]